jgi:hypothetical protein
MTGNPEVLRRRVFFAMTGGYAQALRFPALVAGQQHTQFLLCVAAVLLLQNNQRGGDNSDSSPWKYQNLMRPGTRSRATKSALRPKCPQSAEGPSPSGV